MSAPIDEFDNDIYKYSRHYYFWNKSSVISFIFGFIAGLVLFFLI